MRQHHALVKLGQGNIGDREVGEIEGVGQPVGQQIERVGDHEDAQGYDHQQGPLLASTQATRGFLLHGLAGQNAHGRRGDFRFYRDLSPGPLSDAERGSRSGSLLSGREARGVGLA